MKCDSAIRTHGFEEDARTCACGSFGRVGALTRQTYFDHDGAIYRIVSTKPADEVNHPTHYNQGKVEVIDSIEAACAAIGPDAFKGYLTGNVIKYLSRWNKKGGVQDLKKASWYLNRLVHHVEKP